jgi:hypothetical protein
MLKIKFSFLSFILRNTCFIHIYSAARAPKAFHKSKLNRINFRTAERERNKKCFDLYSFMMRDRFLLHAFASPTKTLNFEIFYHNEEKEKMENSSIRKLKILYSHYCASFSRATLRSRNANEIEKFEIRNVGKWLGFLAFHCAPFALGVCVLYTFVINLKVVIKENFNRSRKKSLNSRFHFS